MSRSPTDLPSRDDLIRFIKGVQAIAIKPKTLADGSEVFVFDRFNEEVRDSEEQNEAEQ